MRHFFELVSRYGIFRNGPNMFVQSATRGVLEVACALGSRREPLSGIESRAQGADSKLLMRFNNMTWFGGIA